MRSRIGLVIAMALALCGWPGTPPGPAAADTWTSEGVPLAPDTAAQIRPRVLPDGSDGAIFVWEDARDGVFLARAQRLTGAGSVAPGWPPDGVTLPNRALAQFDLVAIPDGSGGVFAAADDDGYTGAVLVNHLGGDGVAVAGWPAGAVVLIDAWFGQPGGTHGAFLPVALADGAGGVFVARTYRDRLHQSITVTRLTASGDFASGWGTGVWASTAGWEYPSQLAADGQGGAYVVFVQQTVPARVLVERFDGNGERVLAPTAIATTPLDQTAPALVSDGATGAIVVWEDHRNGAFDQVYAQRVLAGGGVAPGWPADGLRICAFPTTPAMPSDFVFPGPLSSVASDGAGGAFVAWTDHRDAGDPGDVYVQHVLSSGTIAAGWPDDGLAVAAAPDLQERPAIAADGSGGLFVVWQDGRGGADLDVYAQHLLSGGSVASGWLPGGAPVCTAAGDQIDPAVAVDAAGDAFFAWSDARAGTANVYAARIAAGHSPAAVGAPAGRELVLVGAVPNPARGSGLAVRFELPDAMPARIDLVDVGGRRVTARQVGGLGPGWHTIDLREAGELPVGIYLVRLTRGRSTLSAKAVVVR